MSDLDRRLRESFSRAFTDLTTTPPAVEDIMNLAETTTDIAAVAEGRDRAGTRNGRGLRRRPVLALAAVAATAAAVTALSVLPLGGNGGPAASAAAAAVLNGAADKVAGQGGADELRNGNFFYVKSLVTQGDGLQYTREAWIGHREPGRLVNWQGSPEGATVEALPVTPFTVGGDSVDWDGLFALPTDPGELSDRLRAAPKEAGLDGDARAFQAVGDLAEAPASPALRSALYRVAATVPGVKLVGAVRDAAGRPAVAIERDESAQGRGITRYLIEERTGRLLQVDEQPKCAPEVLAADSANCGPYRSTYLVAAPVDRVGERPTATR